MFNHSVRTILAAALVSVPIIWSGVSYPAQAQEAADVEFTLINNSPDRALTHFYIAPTESEDYGPDILLNGVIEPGESGTVTIQEATSTCNYDLWATFGPGEDVGEGHLYETNVNVCEVSSYTYFP